MELNLNVLPRYRMSSFRYFKDGERHVSRVCSEDVLVLVFKGALRFIEAGIPKEVGKGQYYIQKAGLEQLGKEPSDSPRYFYIHFNGDYGGSRNSLPMRGEYDPIVLMPLLRQLEFLEHDITSSLLEKTCVFYQVLILLGSRKRENTAAHELAERLFEEIVRNYPCNLTVGMLAKKYHYSKNYITREFRNHYGATPYRYLLIFRLQKAYQLLLNSAKSAGQICEECGFSDYSVFYRQFVGRYHLSPSKLRKANRIKL